MVWKVSCKIYVKTKMISRGEKNSAGEKQTLWSEFRAIEENC